MKEAKEASCSNRAPKPNLKNKKFENWSKAETSKKDDTLVSSTWLEKLKTVPAFLPAYDNKPVNMIYLLSGEYGRLWTKDRDDWYRRIFIPSPKERDMEERRKKIRKEIREAQKAAEENAKERKVRREKEMEAKKKAEAEKIEKLKARIQKLKAAKQPPKTAKKSHKGSKSSPEPPKQLKDPRPSAQTCECSDHKKETGDGQANRETYETDKREPEPETEPEPEPEHEHEHEPEINQNQDSDRGCTMCEDYIKQLQEVQQANCRKKEFNAENEKGE